jgi:hypothetical protein
MAERGNPQKEHGQFFPWRHTQVSGPEPQPFPHPPTPFGTSPDLPADTTVAPCPSGNKTTRPSHLLKRAFREFPSAGQGTLPQGRVRAIFPVRHAHVSGLEATLDPPRIDRRQHRRCSMPQRQLKHKAFTPRKWEPYKQFFHITARNTIGPDL